MANRCESKLPRIGPRESNLSGLFKLIQIPGVNEVHCFDSFLEESDIRYIEESLYASIKESNKNGISARLIYSLVNLNNPSNKWAVINSEDGSAVVQQYQGHKNTRYFITGHPELIKNILMHLPPQLNDNVFRFVVDKTSVPSNSAYVLGSLLPPEWTVASQPVRKIRANMVKPETRVSKKFHLSEKQISQGYFIRNLQPEDDKNIRNLLKDYPHHTHRDIWPPQIDGEIWYDGVFIEKPDGSSQLVAMNGITNTYTRDGADHKAIYGILGDAVTAKEYRREGLLLTVAASVMDKFWERYPTGEIVVDANSDSVKAAMKLGFYPIEDFYWVVARKK